MKELVKFIAFGAGQCSSVLPFILDDYDLIIFADTTSEHALTYEWIKIVQISFPYKFVWLKPEVKGDPKTWHPPICTKEMKVYPIRRYLRSVGVKKAIKYLGMTSEEDHRMRENGVKWITNKYPLVKLGWTRKTCQKYLLDNLGFVPPRSGCTICKYFDRDHLVSGIKVENKSILNYMREKTPLRS